MLIDFGYMLGLAFSIFMIVITIITWRNTVTIKKNRESFGSDGVECRDYAGAECVQMAEDDNCTSDPDFMTIWCASSCDTCSSYAYEQFVKKHPTNLQWAN